MVKGARARGGGEEAGEGGGECDRPTLTAYGPFAVDEELAKLESDAATPGYAKVTAQCGDRGDKCGGLKKSDLKKREKER